MNFYVVEGTYKGEQIRGPRCKMKISGERGNPCHVPLVMEKGRNNTHSILQTQKGRSTD